MKVKGLIKVIETARELNETSLTPVTVERVDAQVQLICALSGLEDAYIALWEPLAAYLSTGEGSAVRTIMEALIAAHKE